MTNSFFADSMLDDQQRKLLVENGYALVTYWCQCGSCSPERQWSHSKWLHNEDEHCNIKTQLNALEEAS